MTKSKVDSIIFNEYISEKQGEQLEEIQDLLGKLVTNYKLIIVSNCKDNKIEEFFLQNNLEKYFVDFEYNGRTGLAKGENIRLLIKRNNLKYPVYVGNTDGDRRVARLIGIPFIYAFDGEHKVIDYDEKINKFSDMLEVDILK